MRQQKNDFTPGPLTKAGFKVRSYCQENLPDNDKKPAGLFVKDQSWVKTISRRELIEIEIDMLITPGLRISGSKRKLIPFD